MKETRGTLKDHSLHNRREYERHNVGNYPAEVKKPDGTKLNAFLNDISYGGLNYERPCSVDLSIGDK